MPIEIEQHEWREERVAPQKEAMAQRIAMAHAAHRLIDLASQDWLQPGNAGRIADSRHEPGQEAA